MCKLCHVPKNAQQEGLIVLKQQLMINEVDKPKEPPRIAVKFANTVFVLGILYSILLVVYAIYKIYNPSEPVSPAFYIITVSYTHLTLPTKRIV